MKIVARMLLVLSLVAFSTSVVSAKSDKGQKIYLKKLKDVCGINGADMSKKHTQAQWKEIYDGGKLNQEIKTFCPNAEEIKDKYLQDLFDFFYDFASDSGKVPSC